MIKDKKEINTFNILSRIKQSFLRAWRGEEKLSKVLMTWGLSVLIVLPLYWIVNFYIFNSKWFKCSFIR